MHGFSFKLKSAHLTALSAGLLWWADRRLLCVSDLHLGKSDRVARRGGGLLPPYENKETLDRLALCIDEFDPAIVVCLGDSFDDLAGQDALDEDDHTKFLSMMAGRRWIWIEGNHDPGPISIGGSHLVEYQMGPLTFRHIAKTGSTGEVSGHYHPKARVPTRGGGVSRPCFLIDKSRVILPAFGVYTGGLKSTDPSFATVMDVNAVAVLTGVQALPIPMPR